VFLTNGLLYASYFVRIPALKAQYALSDGRLGLFLLLPAAGAFLTTPLAGAVAARIGSRPLIRWATVILPVSLLGLALAGRHLAFALVLLVFGAVNGFMDVAMNTHALAAERVLGRPIMSGCHAGWSIGALVGSAAGGLAIKAELSPATHFGVAAALLIGLAIAVGRFLVPAAADRPIRPRTGPAKHGWTRRIVVLAAVSTAILLTEAAVGAWSGIYLHDVLNATPAAAALGFIGFSVCQTAARLVGDRIQLALGTVRLVLASSIVATAGLALAVLSRWPGPAIAGFATLGLGVAVLLPIIFRTAARSGGRAGAAPALAKVNTFTYGGALAGPVLIGWSAEIAGLRTTFAAMLVMLAVALAAGGRHLGREALPT